MKKLIALTLAVLMALSLVACGGNETPDTTTTAPTTTAGVEVPASALEVMETIWAGYNEEYKSYFMGGDFNNVVNAAPGNYDVTDAELKANLEFSHYIPNAELANIDQAATVQHAMMANNFTGGVFHVTSDAKTFGNTMVDALKNTQWICGQPDLLTVAVIGGEYVLIAFGNSDLMGEFNTQLTAAYADAEILCNESLVG